MPSSDRYTNTSVAAAAVTNFESGTGAWSTGAQASAMAQSTEQAHESANSLKLTRSATATGYMVVSGNTDYPVAASTAYILDWWMYANSTAAVYRIDTDWYTSGQAYISTTTGTNVTCTQNAWTHAGPFTITSAATAAFARPALIAVSGSSTGDLVYLDEIYLYQRLWRHQLPMLQSMNRAATR
ncbi:hypothetical protein C9F11_38300 [Streptomyces sp. YIM 121038]|uniref:hypothetical protein n=1 Tax=Streptomyces sp. YIM 121038 TaxID=2136401 RepID=UPI0011109065|nr:hypothetical protein [Streptomyces sp. YIM 121038]QCX81243.1 hypothetical protein C9F11_38300 [Streptomyces sp. YIM 121038]